MRSRISFGLFMQTSPFLPVVSSKSENLFQFRRTGFKSGSAPAIAIQTFGDFLGFNPHLHVLISEGCFHDSSLLTVAPRIDTRTMQRLFRHHALRMLLYKGKITRDMIALLNKWRHSGFNVFYSKRILPRYKVSMENLARYIIRTPLLIPWNPAISPLRIGNRKSAESQ